MIMMVPGMILGISFLAETLSELAGSSLRRWQMSTTFGRSWLGVN